jgi:hypothetical protein
MKINSVKRFIFSMVVLAGFVFSITAQADVIVYKAYKQTFPDTHPKCIDCHVDAMPKKAEGGHEWNAYGEAVKKAINAAGLPDVPTSENIDQIAGIIKQAGKIEDFKGPAVK